jgi:hypothetical protein
MEECFADEKVGDCAMCRYLKSRSEKLPHEDLNPRTRMRSGVMAGETTKPSFCWMMCSVPAETLGLSDFLNVTSRQTR